MFVTLQGISDRKKRAIDAHQTITSILTDTSVLYPRKMACFSQIKIYVAAPLEHLLIHYSGEDRSPFMRLSLFLFAKVILAGQSF